METMESGSIADAKLLNPQNMALTTTAKELGCATEVIMLQSEKAPQPMNVTDLGIL